MLRDPKPQKLNMGKLPGMKLSFKHEEGMPGVTFSPISINKEHVSCSMQ
jgi:hypothetical protein